MMSFGCSTRRQERRKWKTKYDWVKSVTTAFDQRHHRRRRRVHKCELVQFEHNVIFPVPAWERVGLFLIKTDFESVSVRAACCVDYQLATITVWDCCVDTYCIWVTHTHTHVWRHTLWRKRQLTSTNDSHMQSDAVFFSSFLLLFFKVLKVTK